MISDSRLKLSWTQVCDALPPGVAPDPAKARMVIARALAEHRITLAYQSVVSAAPGRPMAFYKGLLRMRDAGGRLYAITQYLDPATDDDLSIALDIASLSAALSCLEARPWLRLSLSVSPGTIRSAQWIDLLRAAVAHKPDIGYRLIVGLSTQARPSETAGIGSFITELHRLGCSVALDDFGSGTSAFESLREFRFDLVRIDGLLGEGLARNRDSQVLVEVLVRIARHFSMLCIVENISSEDDASCATTLGADCLAGRAISQPLDAPIDPDHRAEGSGNSLGPDA